MFQMNSQGNSFHHGANSQAKNQSHSWEEAHQKSGPTLHLHQT